MLHDRRGTVEALQWKLIGAGYEAIGVQAQGLTYTLISLYLQDTEGPTGPRNAQILASLVAYVRELPEPWIIGGRLITAGEITCTQGEGNELDFVLVSRCIEAAVTLTVDWQGMSRRGIGRRWAKAMEVCRGDPQGRGYQVDKVWGTIQETRVVQASKATAAGWWSRMRRCIITLQAQLSRSTWEQVQGNAKAADVFLQREVGRPEEASFVEEVSRAFEQRQVKALGKLREAAEANEAEAQVQASKASQKQYKAWLNAGVAKGMRRTMSLSCVLNASERCLTAPIQWQQQQVCMLAKKPTIERPIYLTSITYRLWCFARHMIAILIDLETFYDCVDLQLLADRLCEAQFPPVVGALALQAYAGERHIVSEDVLSEGIKPQKGIPAGCPLAITMARVFLAPILREASKCEGLAGLDTWVDDIGADFEDKRPGVVARQALTGYRVLAEGLRESGLKISKTKTGFLASTKEARKELQALLKPEEPKIFNSMRDLGVDCALGRLRRVTHQKARVGKGKKRQGKLGKLKVPVEACKVRLFKGSICASMLWGHQAQGLPPSRVRDLRRAVALQVGLQKLGDLEVVLSAEADRVSDPWATVVMQQVQEWFTALTRWGADQAPLERVWQQTATGFREGLGWSMPGVMEWHRPSKKMFVRSRANALQRKPPALH
ncbi:hypothetical protein AK812_SmicGene44330 [Symbiodinium microadriaticum]|uniref:Reverse transcriptase domain-containing protein n=1 Tax=Symbiodinium microadriaticum TaxID=2951 RepID=A0A1Q9BYR0_SYMMI|nr:hypothetical protein AK812_SmicGene44330 [Symbiodinium microadriaticum]